MPIKSEILTKYKSDEKREFKNNSLDIVKILLSFEKLIEFEKIQQYFFNEIRASYPHKGHLSILVCDDCKDEPKGLPEKFKNTIFTYNDNKTTPSHEILFGPSIFGFACLLPNKKYTTFSTFYNEFEKWLNVLNKIIENFEPTKNLIISNVSLNKINRISYNYYKHLNTDLIKEIDLFTDKPDMMFKKISSDEPNNQTINIHIVFAQEMNEKDLIYDFEVETNNLEANTNFTESELKNLLFDSNLKIYNLFHFFVGESFINNVLDS